MLEMRSTIAMETPSLSPHSPEEFCCAVWNDPWTTFWAAIPQAMAPCGGVLLVGRDVSLQLTRAALLAKVGFRCHLAERVDEVLCKGQNLTRLVIFCYTLPVAEARQAVNLIRRRSPEAVFLRIAMYLHPEEECFGNLLVLPSPGEFVAMVQHLSLPAGNIA